VFALCLSDSRRVACLCNGGLSLCVMRLYVCIGGLWWLLHTIRESVTIAFVWYVKWSVVGHRRVCLRSGVGWVARHLLCLNSPMGGVCSV